MIGCFRCYWHWKSRPLGRRPHGECLDHIIVFGEAHLRRILISYSDYYNGVRTHRSLNKDAPVSRQIQLTGSIKSHAILGGLHHHLRPGLGFRHTHGLIERLVRCNSGKTLAQSDGREGFDAHEIHCSGHC